ncbi:membrane protein [Niallia circulans]|uniref:Membrane protein n=1 Tax=Niallia circulans TaxID=1397 RepID=A0A0J1IL73_NIACI|nr:ABC transporter permease [Niallia circulans]KLV26726.1 membrane protein [Niallia circulans]MED5100105.1 ABC transporter permease [Niallia circulans]
MKTLKQFFKHPETIIGISTAVAFLLIFFCVWMTAYDGVNNRIDKLKIGLVNEDQQIGSMIEKEVVKNVPFEVKMYQSIASAKKDMNQSKLDMVMQIPAIFSSRLQENEIPEINYFINQANATLAKQIMDGAAKNITQSINENVYNYKQQLILSNLQEQLGKNVPSNELAQEFSKGISQALESLNIQSVQTTVEKTNNVDGFAPTMVPLMMVLASYVGSMIMSLNMNIVSSKIKSNYNKWSIFLVRQIINIGASILLSSITLLLFAIFNIELHTSIIESGIFQIFVYFSFLSLTQMFVILFGPGGMLFNILALSLQLVTSGVIIPKTMLSSFYQTIGSYLPATYASNGYYSLIFGGKSLTTEMMALLIVSAVTLFVALVRIALLKKSISTNSAMSQ